MKNGRLQQNSRYVATLEDEFIESTYAEDRNGYAPTHGEMIGEIN